MNPDPELIECEWINSSKLSIDMANVAAEDQLTTDKAALPDCCRAWVQPEPQALDMYHAKSVGREYSRICGRAFGWRGASQVWNGLHLKW